jgi:hypothetical protein
MAQREQAKSSANSLVVQSASDIDKPASTENAMVDLNNSSR